MRLKLIGLTIMNEKQVIVMYRSSVMSIQMFSVALGLNNAIGVKIVNFTL